MNEDKAAVGLRFSIRSVIGATAGDPQSLRNIVATIYPDGALCFVNENRTLYELNKESTATPDNLTIVAAQPAGQGNWLKLTSSPGVASLAQVVATAPAAVATASTTTFVAPSGSAFAFHPAGAPAGWTLAGDILTYHGTETVRALARVTASVQVTAESGGLIWAVATQNGNELGDDPTVSFLPGTQSADVGGTGSPGTIVAEQEVSLAPGDTIQMAFATSASSALSVVRATLTVLIP